MKNRTILWHLLPNIIEELSIDKHGSHGQIKSQGKMIIFQGQGKVREIFDLSEKFKKLAKFRKKSGKFETKVRGLMN